MVTMIVRSGGEFIWVYWLVGWERTFPGLETWFSFVFLLCKSGSRMWRADRLYFCILVGY